MSQSDPETDSDSIAPLIDTLSSSLDTLSTTLTPLLSTPLPEISASLPLLDKAKLYVLYTYTIESLLFTALTISGVDAKEHPVYRELTRVKQYFEKIKEAEERGGAGEEKEEKPTARLDKGAAGRMVKAGLSGNERYDREREERSKKERKGADEKLKALEEKMDVDGDENENGDEDEDGEADDTDGKSKKAKKEKKEKKRAAQDAEDSSAESRKKKKRSRGDKKERVKSNKPPKSAHDVFNGLLEGEKKS